QTNFGGDFKDANDSVGDGVDFADQDFIAYGIEYELQRVPIYGAYISNDGSTVVKINTPLVFNEKYTFGLSPFGNRSNFKSNLESNPSFPQAHVFAKGDPAHPEQTVWSNLDILNHLLIWYWPGDIPIAIGGVAQG